MAELEEYERLRTAAEISGATLTATLSKNADIARASAASTQNPTLALQAGQAAAIFDDLAGKFAAFFTAISVSAEEMQRFHENPGSSVEWTALRAAVQAGVATAAGVGFGQGAAIFAGTALAALGVVGAPAIIIGGAVGFGAGWLASTVGQQISNIILDELESLGMVFDDPAPYMQDGVAILIGDDENNTFFHQQSGIPFHAFGDDGNDIFGGWTGDDVLEGWTGHDYLIGHGGNDIIWGDDGQDRLFGDGDPEHYPVVPLPGADEIHGGTGDDYIEGGSGGDRLFGDSGNDTIYGDGPDVSGGGGDYRDEIHGGLGDDTIFGGAGDNVVTGDAGNDTITSTAGGGTFSGGPGDDTITIESEETNAIFGDAGNDTLTGGAGTDFIGGGDDDDTIFIAAGNTIERTLIGGGGNDTITGGFGTDHISGLDGNDTLIGRQGDDFLDGGAGDDTLDGHSNRGEKDVLRGGAGNDIYHVNHGDTVEDADGDRLRVLLAFGACIQPEFPLEYKSTEWPMLVDDLDALNQVLMAWRGGLAGSCS